MTPDDRFATPIPDALARRLRQVHRYCSAHWPTPLPTRLFVREIGRAWDAVATCHETPGGRIALTVDRRLCYYAALDSLLHEYAHAMVWGATQEHDGPWVGAYVELVRAFEDGDALEDSRAW